MEIGECKESAFRLTKTASDGCADRLLALLLSQKRARPLWFQFERFGFQLSRESVPRR